MTDHTALGATANSSLPKQTLAALPVGGQIAQHVRAIEALVPQLSRELEAAYKAGAVTMARAFVVFHRINEMMLSDAAFKPVRELYGTTKAVKVPALFEQEGVDNVPLAEGFRVGISTAKRASVRPGQKEAAFAYLRQIDKGDLIQETLNASTLSAFAKEMAEQNFDLPQDVFNVADVPNTTVNKTK